MMTETVNSIVADLPVTHDIMPKAASDHMIEQGMRYLKAAGIEEDDYIVRGLWATMAQAASHEAGFQRTTAAHDRFKSSMEKMRG
jgi:hypothetical protein